MLRSDSKPSDRLLPTNPDSARQNPTDSDAILSECLRRGARDRLLAMGFTPDYLAHVR